MWSSTFLLETLSFTFLNYPNARYAIVFIKPNAFLNWKKIKSKLFSLILGQYLQAEVEEGFGRDVMEFLIKRDVVAYRSMATKVTYIYPFTTALGDSKGQTERMNKIMEELGCYAPSFESMDQSMQSSAEDFME